MVTRKPFPLFILILLLLAVSSSDRTVWASGYTNVTVEQAKEMIDSNPSLVILDVRNQSEYDSGHIRNARLIPLNQLESRLGELDKNRTTLVYCQTGGRSASASQILANNNFTQVYNMLGGIASWKNEGYPLYVRYSSIQEAINNATAGDTLRISSGVYVETITIDKTLSLEGENKTTTIISNNYTQYHTITINADKVTITDFTIKNGYYAIFCQQTSQQNLTIQNNIVQDNRIAGITLYGMWHSIRSNVIKNNGFGIIVGNNGNSTITQNTMINNSASGIELRNSKNNKITENLLAHNMRNIAFYTGSDNNTVADNDIVSSALGITMHDSRWNRITENLIEDNGSGISLLNSNNNTVYHNNIINNTAQLDNKGSTNRWDNGFLEGNYWSDYNGTDSDCDGVGDEFLPWQNVDYHPLMSSYLEGDLNHDGTVGWPDADLLNNAWQSRMGAINYNPHADFNIDSMINIKDATIICLNWLKNWQD